MDGIHKLGRIILAAYTVGVLAAVVVMKPDVSIEILGVISAPALGYITLKWTGAKVNK